MTDLRKMMLEELERRNYAQTTIRTYIQTVEDFTRYFKPKKTRHLPSILSPEEVARLIDSSRTGAGKTAVIRQLEMDGFSVVEEAATDIIALWRAKGIAEAWTRPEFIDAMVSLQQIRQGRAACAADAVQFHDRSVVCTAALADYQGVDSSPNLLQELRRVKEENVFQNTVLFLKNLGFITRTDARRITKKRSALNRFTSRPIEILGSKSR